MKDKEIMKRFDDALKQRRYILTVTRERIAVLSADGYDFDDYDSFPVIAGYEAAVSDALAIIDRLLGEPNV